MFECSTATDCVGLAIQPIPMCHCLPSICVFSCAIAVLYHTATISSYDAYTNAATIFAYEVMCIATKIMEFFSSRKMPNYHSCHILKFPAFSQSVNKQTKKAARDILLVFASFCYHYVELRRYHKIRHLRANNKIIVHI